MSRTVFIGDVHGCLEELKALVKKISLRPSDRVIVLGDLINRGPDSVGVIEYVYEKGFHCIMGNHDYDYACHFEQRPIYQAMRKQLSDEIHTWFVNLPFYIETPQFIAVHAGLQPGVELGVANPEILMSIRSWDGKGHNLKSGDNPPWHEFYLGDKPVFYGHWAKQGLHIANHTYGLDTGCVYGKELTAYILEEKKIVQVGATAVYYRQKA